MAVLMFVTRPGAQQGWRGHPRRRDGLELGGVRFHDPHRSGNWGTASLALELRAARDTAATVTPITLDVTADLGVSVTTSVTVCEGRLWPVVTGGNPAAQRVTARRLQSRFNRRCGAVSAHVRALAKTHPSYPPYDCNTFEISLPGKCLDPRVLRASMSVSETVRPVRLVAPFPGSIHRAHRRQWTRLRLFRDRP